MIPKKTILMYCPNQVTRDVLVFQMETWGYSVTATSELCLLPATLRGLSHDLVLLLPGFKYDRWNEFHKTAQQLEFLQIELGGAIRIYDTQRSLPVSVAPTVHRIPNVDVNSAEYLRCQLKLITVRKRGPKKRHVPQDLAVCA